MSGLKIFTSNRLETLCEHLSNVLTTPLASSLSEEIVVVQSRGMEKWLRMQLARRHGICANYRFPFPNTIIDEIFEEILQDQSDNSMFDPGVMKWRLMESFPFLSRLSRFKSVKSYLGDPIRPLKLYQLSERMADLFDQYLVYRPGMIMGWEKGEGSHWQAILWRELMNRNSNLHRAALRVRLLEKIKKRTATSENLPQRIAVFGISALPPYHMEIFAAISQLLEVNLFLMNPCREYWFDILSERDVDRILVRQKKSELTSDELHLERGNSLLASMGKLGRDFFSIANGFESIEYEDYQETGAGNLLTAIQSDILNLCSGEGSFDERKLISEDDTSIQIHSCHSAMREMEILYDHLLSMFENDPKLEPNEILVMAPDIEVYESLIQAVFGVPEEEGLRIPFTIADKTLIKESSIGKTYLEILDLWGSRFEAPKVLTLLECPSVRKQFSLSQQELRVLNQWVRDTGIRWGIDEKDRAGIGLPASMENTWQFGIDRLLLGYALPGGGEQLFNGIMPYDHVEGNNTVVLGKLAEFISRLTKHVKTFGGKKTLREWSQNQMGVLESFFLNNDDSEIELQMIRTALHELRDAQELSGFSDEVEFEVVKEYLTGQLERKGFGFGFMSEGVTFCSMLPMRSIPFKVICMVGMNNETYPRQSKRLGFDLMAKSPLPGDRSRRDDDRYLFLEAILSARQTLYISHIGQSLNDNTSIPPSVLVSELTDYIKKGFSISGENDSHAMGNITIKHRLQAFSPSYFRNDPELLSYSSDNCMAARQFLEMRQPRKPFIEKDLPIPSSGYQTIDLEALVRFIKNPARFLLRERLGITLGKTEGIIEETEPITVDGLERYQLEQILLKMELNGKDLSREYNSIKATGLIPHGTFGKCIYDDLCRGVKDFAERINDLSGGVALDPVELELNISDFSLTGQLNDVYPSGLVQYRYAKAKAKDYLKLWVSHLFMNELRQKGYLSESLLLCRDGAWSFNQVKEGNKFLREILDIYLMGLRKPIHFFPESSLKYAQAILDKGKSEQDALNIAVDTWLGSEFKIGESQDEYYQLCFGETDPFDNDFKDLSIQIYGPILKARSKVL